MRRMKMTGRTGRAGRCLPAAGAELPHQSGGVREEDEEADEGESRSWPSARFHGVPEVG